MVSVEVSGGFPLSFHREYSKGHSFQEDTADFDAFGSAVYEQSVRILSRTSNFPANFFKGNSKGTQRLAGSDMGVAVEGRKGRMGVETAGIPFVNRAW
jgi:hypothetical protein